MDKLLYGYHNFLVFLAVAKLLELDFINVVVFTSTFL